MIRDDNHLPPARFQQRHDPPLESYRPSPVEVSGLISVPAEALADLVEGVRDSLEVELFEFHLAAGLSRSPLRLRSDDLVPYDAGYHRRLAGWAAELIDGA